MLEVVPAQFHNLFLSQFSAISSIGRILIFYIAKPERRNGHHVFERICY